MIEEIRGMDEELRSESFVVRVRHRTHCAQHLAAVRAAANNAHLRAAHALVIGLLAEAEAPAQTRAEVPLSGASRAVAADVRRTGIGRVIAFRSDTLPSLPKGEYYELWFVGPGDRPGRPDRISAGTFHPDENGRSNAEFTAAVDPALYPELSVTAEPRDGDPLPNGPEVLRSRG